MLLKIHREKLVNVCQRCALAEKFHLPIYVVFNTGRKTDRETDNERLGSDAISEANGLSFSRNTHFHSSVSKEMCHLCISLNGLLRLKE